VRAVERLLEAGYLDDVDADADDHDTTTIMTPRPS
jgi:hypothetical protein